MALGNIRGLILTIAAGGTQSDTVTLGTDALLGLSIPALSACTLTISGAVDARLQDRSINQGGMGAISDKYGLQVLVFQSTTGGFTLGAEALKDLTGVTRIKIGSSVTQNSACVFQLSQHSAD